MRGYVFVFIVCFVAPPLPGRRISCKIAKKSPQTGGPATKYFRCRNLPQYLGRKGAARNAASGGNSCIGGVSTGDIFSTFAAVNPFYGTCKRYSLCGAVVVHLRIGAALHAAARRGLFAVRGAVLPLGRRGVVSGCTGRVFGTEFPAGTPRIGHRLPAEPFSRRHVAEPYHRLSAYRQRRRIDHLFHVSARRGSRHDVFLPRERLCVGFRRYRHVRRRRGAALAGECRFHGGK